jgi:N-acetylglutamate synthase-like GNAT family acetyltransferase
MLCRQMRIREAMLEDTTAISDLIRPLAEKYIAHEFSPKGARNLLSSIEPEAIRGYFKSGYKYHIAEENGVLVGVVAVRDNMHLYHLFVPDTFRGQGFARKLWQVAHDACRDADNVGEYRVNSSSFAVGMYRRFGFVETGPPETRNGVRAVLVKLIEAA